MHNRIINNAELSCTAPRTPRPYAGYWQARLR